MQMSVTRTSSPRTQVTRPTTASEAGECCVRRPASGRITTACVLVAIGRTAMSWRRALVPSAVGRRPLQRSRRCTRAASPRPLHAVAVLGDRGGGWRNLAVCTVSARQSTSMPACAPLAALMPPVRPATRPRPAYTQEVRGGRTGARLVAQMPATVLVMFVNPARFADLRAVAQHARVAASSARPGSSLPMSLRRSGARRTSEGKLRAKLGLMYDL